MIRGRIGGNRNGGRKQGRHPEKALSAAFVRTVTEPGRHGDGHGLYLLVTDTGARCWMQRLTIRGRRRELGLGGFPLGTCAGLAGARCVKKPSALLHRAARFVTSVAGTTTWNAPEGCGWSFRSIAAKAPTPCDVGCFGR